MLQITVSEKPEQEYYDDSRKQFITIKAHKAFTLQLEHSLISLSKWESKWKKPFLSQTDKLTSEELIDYIRCMTIGGNIEPEAYNYLSQEEVKKIFDYVSDSHTATTINDRRNRPHRNETVTSELIYYWMIECQIPHECEKWHLNRLLTLIKICNIKQTPEQKMSRQSIYAQNKALNSARRARMHSRG